jgi:hypothetical protein
VDNRQSVIGERGASAPFLAVTLNCDATVSHNHTVLEHLGFGVGSARIAVSDECGARIVPTPKELKQWRLDARFSRREMGRRLKIAASYVAYLENGKRSPSATVIRRYWKFIPN